MAIPMDYLPHKKLVLRVAVTMSCNADDAVRRSNKIMDDIVKKYHGNFGWIMGGVVRDGFATITASPNSTAQRRHMLAIGFKPWKE